MSGATLRVMTWNLWWRFGPWEARQPAIATVVAREAPDVLLAQEVWSDGPSSAAHELATALGYHAAITDDPFGGRDVGFHNAILSRWPLSEVASHPLPRADGSPGHRRVLMADVATPWGPWTFASTHFDYRFDDSAVRVLQARELLRLVHERRGDPETSLPVVVGGDLNAVPDSDEIRLLTGRAAGPHPGLVLSDCWEHAGDGPGHTWRADNPYQADTAWPNRRLDYLLVSWPRPKPVGNAVRCHLAGLGPIATEFGPVVPSDHAAVVADLRAPDG